MESDSVGKSVVFDKSTNEGEFGLGSGGEAGLDLLEAALDEEVEEDVFLLDSHRINECLISIAEVGRGPTRGLGDPRVGPLSVREHDGLERPARRRESARSFENEGPLGLTDTWWRDP